MPNIAPKKIKTIIEESVNESAVDEKIDLAKKEIKEDLKKEIQDELLSDDPLEEDIVTPELENESRVVVYRFNKETKKFARLDEWGIKEFSIGLLGDTYGGGTYKIYIFKPNGQIAKHKIIEIDELKKPKIKNEPVEHKEPKEDQQAIAKAIETIHHQQSKFFEMMTTMMMTMMQNFAQTISASKTNNNNDGLIKSIDDLIKIKNFLKEQERNPAKDIDVLIDTFKKGIEISQLIPATSDTDNPLNGLINILINKIGSSKLLESFSTGINTHTQPNPSHLNIQHIPNIPNTQINKENKMNILYNFYLNQLKKFASSNADISKVSAYALSKIPADYIPMVYDILKSDELEHYLNVYIGDIYKTYPEYIKKLINQITSDIEKMFSDMQEESNDEDPSK